MVKIEFLKEKAEAFLEDAEYDISRKKWFLAAFHLEQTCQLYLKYYLFLKLKDFPKTHSLSELLIDIGEVYQIEKEIKRLRKEHASVIGDLEQAYISSRYLPVEFYSDQVKEMEKFVKKLIKFLKKL